MGHVELFEQLLIRRCLLQRVELHPMDVLEERVSQHGVVSGFPDDGRDRLEAGFLTGAPAAFAHHQLVRSALDGADDDRLHQAELTDRVDEFRQGLFVENSSWLLGVGVNQRGRDLSIHRAGRGEVFVGASYWGSGRGGRGGLVT